MFSTTHQPVTEMECAVAAMLEGSEHVIPNDKDLSEAERKALTRLTMEEVKFLQIEFLSFIPFLL